MENTETKEVVEQEVSQDMCSMNATPFKNTTLDPKEVYVLKEQLFSIIKIGKESYNSRNQEGIIDNLYKDLREVQSRMESDYNLYRTQPFLCQLCNKVDRFLETLVDFLINTTK